MPKKSSLIIMLTLSIALTGIIFFIKPAPPKKEIEFTDRFFPNLLENIDEVSSITITTNKNSFHINKQENSNWVISEKDDYPASLNKISEVVYGVAELIPIAKKTNNKDSYAQIGVQDPANTGSTATMITLQDKYDTELASILLGKQRTSRTNPNLAEIFVRQPDKVNSWLVVGNLPTYTSPIDWVDTEILKINPLHIAEIDILNPKGTNIKIRKDSLEQQHFILVNIPENYELNSQYEVDAIALSLGQLKFNDVIDKRKINFDSQNVYKLKLKTFTGMLINIEAIENEDKIFITVEADMELPIEVTSTKDLTNSQNEVKGIKDKFKNWAFVLPNYEAKVIKKTMEELTKEKAN